MEAHIHIIADLPNESVQQSVCLIFGYDRPIFEEEVEPKLKKAFLLTEELCLPDDFELKEQKLNMNWVAGYDAENEAGKIMQALASLGSEKITAYVWMDEYEVVFYIEGAQLIPITDVKPFYVYADEAARHEGESELDLSAAQIALYSR